MYWLPYSQMKNDTKGYSLVQMVEKYEELCLSVLHVWDDVDPNYWDTPFYEYMVSDIEHTCDCFGACLEEKVKEQELNYYCLRCSND